MTATKKPYSAVPVGNLFRGLPAPHADPESVWVKTAHVGDVYQSQVAACVAGDNLGETREIVPSQDVYDLGRLVVRTTFDVQ